MRWGAMVPATLFVLGTTAPSLPASAEPSVPGLGDCPLYGDVHICSAEIPSWDGSPLDVDLTLPQLGGGGRHPLMVMLHVFANNKYEWESLTHELDKTHKSLCNNHRFAMHGFD